MQFFHRWLLPITIKVCTTRVIFCSEFKRGIEKEPKCKNYYKKILLPSLLFSLYVYYMNLRTLHIVKGAIPTSATVSWHWLLF